MNEKDHAAPSTLTDALGRRQAGRPICNHEEPPELPPKAEGQARFVRFPYEHSLLPKM
jgi:hypothetical protein